MKSKEPSPETIVRFQILSLIAVVTVFLAFIPYEASDFLASFAATQWTAKARLRTIGEQDDARILHAFGDAKHSLHTDARLTPDPHPFGDTRDAKLAIFAGSKSEAVNDIVTMSEAMQATFSNNGPGALYNIDTHPYADPVPNAKSVLVQKICNGVALAILIAGAAIILRRWRRESLPKLALFGALAFVLTLTLPYFNPQLWSLLLVAAVPILFIMIVTRQTLRVRKARSWWEGRARITASKVEVVRHRFAGDATQVRNQASVAYEFNPGARLIQGERISLGERPADEVDEVLKRYPVGAIVPVFFNPENPDDCVLERNPPASLGCIWTGTVIAVLVYIGVVALIWKGENLNDALNAALPGIHRPLLTLCTGAFGLLCLGSFIYNRSHPRIAFPWLPAKAVIVSSTVESFVSTDTRSHTFYQPVIEYSYQVDGLEYHGTVGQTAGSRTSAEAEVAAHPAGMEIEIHYDPKKPAHSSQSIDTQMVLNGNASLVVAILMLAIAAYSASH